MKLKLFLHNYTYVACCPIVSGTHSTCNSLLPSLKFIDLVSLKTDEVSFFTIFLHSLRMFEYRTNFVLTGNSNHSDTILCFTGVYARATVAVKVKSRKTYRAAHQPLK